MQQTYGREQHVQQRLLDEIIGFNRSFVEQSKFEPYLTSKFPDKKFVILTCMDTRLIELLPASMNIKNGDVKMIKSAGGVVSTAFGGIMRSIIVAIYELGAEEVLVIGHHDCGMSNINPHQIKSKFLERGIPEDTLQILENSGLHIEHWLRGFSDVTEAIKSSVSLIRHHPLVPKIPIHGLVIDPKTGKLDVVDEGYRN
ncbi:carbonic anhydrase [Paenibacillus hemerocallicola]|uniref:carbonic anhydrase n=1 Tax=Paenibacillus hemerocallicola TaxID=1172614 RepID=A0A5C4T2S8_9BACL|nr:carbonic anhydrase [Paenibacillus hemerocallicola]